MPVKLFLLGRPGCGKSRAAKYIENYIKLDEWITKRFKDYDILKKMFDEDILEVRFRATERGGFDVLDVTVLDEALITLEADVNMNVSNAEVSNIEKKELIIIEIARENYDKAFIQFSSSFLQDAHFMFINADFEKCKQRIHERIINPTTDDDHDVSDFALDTYYINQFLPQDKTINKKLSIVENQNSWANTAKEINRVVQHILKKR